MGSNSVQFQVELGIQGAKKQAEELKKILTESVTPNTKGYDSILKLLDKIGTAADGLRGRLTSAFATSKTSSTFLRDYEKLLEMLNTVKASFSGLGLQEIKISVKDSEQVEEYQKKIKALQEQIDAVSGGKIGGFFNLDEFKEAKALLEQLKIDPSNLTFKGLGDQLKSELDKVQAEADSMQSQFRNVQSVIDNLGKGNLDTLNDSLIKATENADGLVRKISDANERRRINTAMIRDLDTMDGISLKANRITESTDINKFIEDETKRIIDAYDKRIEELKAKEPEIKNAMDSLKGQKDNDSTMAIINSDQIKQAFASLNLTSEYNNFISQAKEMMEAGSEAVKAGAQDLASKMSEALRKGVDTSDLEQWRAGVVDNIQAIFGDAGEVVVSKGSKFTNALKSIFSGANVDISQIKSIKEILDNIKEGDSAADTLHRISEAFKEYATSAGESNTDNKAKYDELAAKLTNLENAIKGVNAAEESGKQSTESKRQEIEQLKEAITTLLQKYQELTGQKANIDLGSNEINKGKTALESYINTLTKFENKQKALSNIQMAVTRWMGFYQVLNLTKKAINDMKQHVQELDTVMTKIAVVTNFSQDDLWDQISKYSEIARQYGVAIKGVYEVSQIYYQQGLNKTDVMGLTTETLKMARIAGLDYATAADYMTTAIRGFQLEMSEAAHVTDVFSNLAAHTASNTEELATAISKTASAAESVGASFESTSAMIATMVATTRESATNIGSALKSIIARYGELKTNMTGTDAEGEEYSLNKVDKALQSVGISVHDAAGQFRDFDDVILELATAWDSIDKNTQRYIATVMAGNRQQSRFLALVSNVEEYKKALELANNADASGEIQTLKTLDSIDAKIERMKVTIQEFYTSSGIQDLYKNILDTITNIISGANSLPKMFGKIPALALTVGFQIVNIIKNVAKLAISTIAASIESLKGTSGSVLTGITSLFGKGGADAGRTWRENADKEMSKVGQGVGASAGKNLASIIGTRAGALISMAGSALSLSALNDYGASTSKSQDQAAAGSMFGAAALTGGGSALSGAITGFVTGGPWGALAGGLIGLASGIPSLISAINMNNVTKARELELSNKSLTEAKQTATVDKGKANELNNAYKKLQTLYDNQFDSVESMQEYKDYMNELASSYPELITSMETTGDRIIELTNLERRLAEARVQSAQSTADAAYEELKNNNKKKDLYQEILDENMFNPTVWKVAGTTDDMYENLATLVGTHTGATSTATLWNVLDKYEAWRQQQANPNDYAEWDIDKWGGRFMYGTSVGDWIEVSSNKEDLNKFLMESLRGTSGSTYNTFQGSLSEQLINNLNTIKNKFTQGGLDFSLNELLGRQVESVDDIKTWSVNEILDASEKLRDRLEKYIGTSVDQIDAVNNYLKRVNIELGVQHNLESLEDPHTANELNEYASLMSFMLEGRYKATKEPINWEEAGNQDIISSLREWIDKNREAAQELMDIDYSQYRSFNEIDFGTEVTEIEGWDEYLNKSFLPAFEKARTQAMEGLTEQLEKSGLSDSSLAQLVDNVIDTDSGNGELNTALINNLRNGIAQYRALVNKELNQEASNLLSSLSSVYEIVGSYTSGQQTLISSIITNIDWSNDESISSAAESLRSLGPEFEELADELDLAALRFASSLTTRTMQLRDSAKDIAKNIEQVADQIGKGVKTSEALENVNTMLENYTGDDKDSLTFDKLYQWDEVLNAYVLTDKGIQVWFDSINSKNEKDIENAKEQLKQIKAIYGDTDTEGLIFSAETEIYRADVSKAIIESFRGEDGLIHASEDQIEAITDSFMADYERLQKEFSEQSELSWAEFIQKKKDSLILTNESEIATLEAIPAQILASKIAAVDYKSIAGGSYDKHARTNLEALLRQAGIDENELGEAFDNIWNRLLEGDYEAYNDLLKKYNVNFQVSSEAEIESARADFEQYQEAFSEIFTKPIESWSKATKELAGITEDTDLSTIDVGTVADNFLESIQRLVSIGVVSIEEYNSIISSRIKYNQEQAGVGKQKKLFNAMSNGFTIDELVSLGGMDENGNLKSELSGLIELDTVTGDYKIKAKATVTETIQALAKALNITLDTTSEAYKDAISSGVDEANSKAEKQNSDLQAKKVFESLRSATVGTNINASQSDLAQYILKKAGFNVDKDGNVTIESEEDLKKIAELERVLREDISEETKAANPEVVKYINEMVRTYKSDRNRYSALSGIISKTVTQDAADKVKQAFGDTSTTDEFMSTLGFYYESELGVYIAAADSIEKIQAKINELNTSIEGETNEDIKRQLQEQVTALQSSLNLLQAQFNDPNAAKRTALGNLLSNYTDISDEVYSEFMAQFGLKEADVTGVFTIKDGKREADLNALKEKVGQDWAVYFESYINALADEYINNVSKAGSLVTEGTTSKTEMAAFQKAYKDLVGTDISFVYDPILKAWTFDASKLHEYVTKAADKLDFGGNDETKQKWIEDQINAMTLDNLDFSQYLSAETQTQKDSFKKTLVDYFKTHKGDLTFETDEALTEWAEKQATDTLNGIKEGGQAAVDYIKSVKGDKATSQELQAAYEAQIAPIRAAAEAAETLEVGSFVSTEQIQALTVAGFKIDGNRVVAVAKNLSSAYKSLYDQMVATGEATSSELNAIAAKQLDSKYVGKRTVLDTLSRDVLTVDDIINMYSANGKTFGEYTKWTDNGLHSYKEYDPEKALQELVDQDVIELNEIGEIRIKNFKEYASRMGLREGTQSYAKAYSQWIDQKIAHNEEVNSGQQIAQALSQLSSQEEYSQFNAKTLVDKLDLSEYADKFKEYGIDVSDEIWNITSEAQRDQVILLLENAVQAYADANADDAAEILAMFDSIKSSIKSGTATKYNAVSSVISTSVSKDAAKDLAKAMGQTSLTESSVQAYMESLGFKYNAWKQQFEAGSEALAGISTLVAELKADNLNGENDEQIRELEAAEKQLRADLTKTRQQNALLTVLQNYQNVSYEAFAELENAFGAELDSYITKDTGMDYQVDGAGIVSYLRSIGFTFGQAIDEQLAQMTDDYLSNIKNAASLVSSGTTSVTEMESFAAKYKASTGVDPSFIYNDILDSWTLDPTDLRAYIESQAQSLVKEGKLAQEDVSKYIDSLTRQAYAENVKISDYLNAEDRGGKARDTLKNQMSTYLKSILESTNPVDYIKQAQKNLGEEWDNEVYLTNEINRLAKDAAKRNKDTFGYNVEDVEGIIENDIKTLNNGREAAIEVLKKYAGEQELTAQQIEAAYKARSNRYLNAIDKISTIQVHDVVSKDMIDDLRNVGFTITDDGVVKQVATNMVAAYNDLYARMETTGTATIADLNQAYASIINENESKEMTAISALGDAMGMTYDGLSELLTKQGLKLSDYFGIYGNQIKDIGVNRIGNGKLRIMDFDKFASELGLVGGSEEYTAAFKEYNDALIELDRKTEKSIVEELNNITSASGGQRVNLTQIQNIIDTKLDDPAKKALTQSLTLAGAQLEKGILSLSDRADIPGIIDSILSQSEIANSLLPEEIASLQDAINGLLSDMASQISSGIEGSLDNSGKVELEKFAKKRGVDLTFKKTEKGLKLSNQSALQLYTILKSIDSLQAQSLLPDISEMSDKYKTLQDVCLRYNSLINANTEALRREKAVLEDLMKSMMTDPSSYNFMSGGLTPEWEYAENYVKNLAGAKKAITDSAEQNEIGLSDFYNIVRAAGAYNENFSLNGMNANQLLNYAGNFIRANENGEAVIDLTKAKLTPEMMSSLYSQLKTGLMLFSAESEAYFQIGGTFSDISDAISALPPIDFSQLFSGEDVGENGASKYLGQLKEIANDMPELKDQFSSIKIGGKSLYDLLSSGWDDWASAGFKSTEQMTNFLKGISDIDWSDQTKYASQVSELLSSQKLPSMTFDVGTNGFISVVPTGDVIKVDLTNEKFKQSVVNSYNQLFNGAGATKENILNLLKEAWGKYTNDNTLSIEEKLKYRQIIGEASGEIDASTIKQDGNKYTGKINGKTVSGNSKAEVLSAMAKVLMYADKGYDVDIGDDGTVLKGHKRIGKAEVEYDIDNEKYKCDAYGITADSEEELMYKLAEKGLVEEAGVYEYDGKSVTVMKHSTLGIYYTYNAAENKWSYNGQDFGSYQAMLDYIALNDKYGGTAQRKTEGNVETIEISKSAKIVTTIKPTGITTEYFFKGQTIKSQAAFDALVRAEAQLGSNVTSGESGISIDYPIDGGTVNVKYNTIGGVTYTFTGAGTTITAGDEASLKAALAAHIQPKGGSLNGEGGEGEGGISYTLETTAGVKVQISNGQVTHTEGEGADDVAKQATDYFQSQLDKKTLTADATVDVEATVGTIKGDASSATVELTAPADGYKVKEEIKEASGTVTNLKLTPQETTVEGDVSESVADDVTITVKVDKEQADQDLAAATKAAGEVGKLTPTITIKGVNSDALLKLAAVTAASVLVGALKPTVQIKAQDNATSIIASVQKAIDDLKGKTVYISVVEEVSEALGNLGLATGNVGGGPAHAQSTLMGELGPELVVSHGHYFVAGQHGAEFVNLDKDAIVFNHLQTKSLLEHGTSSSRGRAITNERVAVAYARGSIAGGPAKVSVDEDGSPSTGDAPTGTGGGSKVSLSSLTKEQKSKLAQLLSDLITKGFDAIDWDDIEKELGKELTDKLKKEAKEAIKAGNLRDFIGKYVEYAGKTIKEANEMIFQAWQVDLKDKSEEYQNALEGLQFFGDGTIGGTAADLTAILGNDVKLQDLLKQGIITWDATLKQYIIKDLEALKALGKDLTDSGTGIAAIKDDNIRETFETIQDYLRQGLEGTLGSKDKEQLNKLLDKMGLDKLGKTYWDELASGNLLDASALDKLKESILKSDLDDAVKEALLKSLDQMASDNIETLKDLLKGSISDGLTDEDKQKLRERLKALGITNVDNPSAWFWDEQTKTWTLTLEEYNRIINELKNKEKLGSKDAEQLYALMQDSLREITNTIQDYIKDALAGELSFEDKSKLKVLLEKMGFDGLDEKFWDELGSGNLLDPAAIAAIKEQIAKSDLDDNFKDYLCAQFDQMLTDSEQDFRELLDSTQMGVGGISDEEKQALEDRLAALNISIGDFWQKMGDQWVLDLDEYKNILKQLKKKGRLNDDQYDELIAKAQDSADAITGDIIKYIEESIKGTLSSENKNKLQQLLKLNGLTEISSKFFTDTVNGWMVKLSGITAYAKYVANQDISNDLKTRMTDTINDTIRSTVSSIADLITKGLKGSLSNAELTDIKEFIRTNGIQGVTIEAITQTSDGLKIATEQAALLYSKLQAINAVAGETMFKALSEQLQSSNDKYKTMSSLLAHIADLNQKINDKTKYSSKRIEQYEAELALAKEIAEIRATTEDSSFSFIDQALPGALNNPLNYLSSWQTGMQALQDAAENGIIDFKTLYNMAKEINQQAAALGKPLEFMGITLDGTAGAFEKITTLMSQSIGMDSDTGKIGVSLEKMGQSLTAGAESYGDSADEAMHEMARSQIIIIKGLIKMLDTIIALEDLQKLDTNDDGIFSFDDMGTWIWGENHEKKLQDFNEKFTKKRDEIIESIRKGSDKYNEDLARVMDEVKINNKTLTEIIKQDPEAWTESDAEVLNAVLQAVQSGDYDLDNIAGSMRSILMKKLNNGSIEIGDIKLSVRYGIIVEEKDGKFLDGKGNEWDTIEDAARSTLLINLGADTKTIKSIDGGKMQGIITVGEQQINVITDGESTLYHSDVTGEDYSSMASLLRAEWKQYALDNGLTDEEYESAVAFEEWKIKQGYKVVPSLNDEVDSSAFTKEQISALLGKTYDELQEEWDKCQTEDEKLAFEAKYGLSFEGANSEKFDELKQILGIEQKKVEIVASVDGDSETEALLKALETGEADVTVHVTTDGSIAEAAGATSAKGNVALAAGRTLMGELGPELVVSNGRYFTVGNNGAEFVNLPKDAIVFNHLQTAQLLNNGSTGHGTPATNERNAVSLASGNAMASAREAKATLESLLAMWESMLNMSVKDLVTTSSSSSSNTKQTGAWLAQVERWYNLLQKIARIEKQINYEEALRNKMTSDIIPNGEAYFASQLRQLELTRQTAAAQAELAKSKEEYFNTRREELNADSPFSQFYTYDEFGQINFKEGGFEQLESIVHQSDTGETLTAQEQWNRFRNMLGEDIFDKYAEYNSDGTKITKSNYEDNEDQFFADQVQAVWDRMEAERQEMQALYDDKEDAKIKYLEGIEAGNKILQEIRSNQKDVENKILEAIETREQKTIDEMTKQREKLSNTSQKYIAGLTEALSNERKLYESESNNKELATLRRQLSILQRTGGSASQIASLQKDIAEKEKNAYFEAQQNSIEEVQKASDLELEKLQEQIDLATESLEYQKEHGLLWAEVTDIMGQSRDQIIDFITGNSSDWAAASGLAQQDTINELLNSVGQFKAYSEGEYPNLEAALNNGFESVVTATNEKNQPINITVKISDIGIGDKEVTVETQAIPGFAGGGEVDFTGLAKLHGSKELPELILNAEETRSWKKDIVGNSNKSLMSRLYELSSMLGEIENGSKGINNNSENGVNIEHVELNMNVNEIANDYDARRAGESAMEEILKIARKTGYNSVRR